MQKILPRYIRGILFKGTMDWTNKLGNIGGGLGGVSAYILNVNLLHVVEIGVYALVGSLIGEGVKELIILLKNKK